MSDTRKISAYIPSDIYRQIEQEGKKATEAVNEALAFYYKNLNQTNEYKRRTIEQDKMITELEHKLMMRDAQVYDLDEHIKTLKAELGKVREDATHDKEVLRQQFDTHALQVQTLINQLALDTKRNEKKWWEIWK